MSRPSATLPQDATLLPISDGALLISCSHATFCRVPRESLPAIREVISGRAGIETLSPDLVRELERHGFFAEPRPAPPQRPAVQLQLTNQCNLACTYCCTNSGEPRADELGYEGWTKVVDEALQEAGPGLDIGILGGEPLLASYALDLGAYILSRGGKLTVFTNGVPLAVPVVARRAAELIEREAVLRVSLAGATRASCDGVSGAQRFDQVVAGLKSLAAHGGRAVVDLMLLPEQVEIVAENLPALRKLLPEGTRVCIGLAYCGGREVGAHVFESRAALEAALDRVAFGAGEVVPAAEPSPLTARRDACPCALGSTLHVRSDGRLFTCFKMEEEVGDLRHESFAAAWERLQNHPQPARSLPFCRDCALASLCGGGCRAENLLHTGDADTPVCGPWRVRVLSELLAEDCVSALHWPAVHLMSEARRRGIEAPEPAPPKHASLHVL
jgi:radical SAM protein with 4Fe4S-binding SPASM domain